MRKSYTLLLLVGIYSTGTLAQHLSYDPFEVQGTYSCNGFDSIDGAYPTPNPQVKLAYNSEHSDPKQLHGSYDFKLVEPDGSTYSGMAALNGSNLAIYFENDDKVRREDRGIGAANLIREFIKLDVNNQPVYNVKFDKFYYERDYGKKDGKNGSHGSEICTKISSNP